MTSAVPIVAAGAVLLGAAIGSFLNVVIARVPRGVSVIRPPSSCPFCGALIAPRDNIPVISFLLLRGKCRACGEKISVRYPIVEAGIAALGGAVVVRFGASETAAFAGLAGTVLVVLALIDLEHQRVPNVILLPAIGGAAVWILALVAASGRWSVAANAFASAAAGFGLLLAVALISGGMGFGDVKLAAFIGLFAGRFGWQVFALALFSAFILGGLFAVVLLVTGRRGRKDALPFAPALASGALLAVFLGKGPVSAWLGV